MSKSARAYGQILSYFTFSAPTLFSALRKPFSATPSAGSVVILFGVLTCFLVNFLFCSFVGFSSVLVFGGFLSPRSLAS
jgi:hypothetical protein